MHFISMRNYLNKLNSAGLVFSTAFVAMAGFSSPGAGATLVVGAQGPYKSISAALQMARNGDRIVVEAGVYREGNIEVNKSVELIGKDFPQIDGENKYEVLTITADSVVIRGFVIQNVGISFVDDLAGIRIVEVRNCIIEGNILRDTFFGIYLEKSAACRISSNQIQAHATREATSGNGIHLWYCKDITIENNWIRGHRDGIYFEFVEYSKIHSNVSEKNLRYGLHFMFSNHCTYTENTFRHNGAGVAVMYTDDIEMVKNRFENNWGPASFGILLKEIRDSQIHHNWFIGNTTGLYAEGSDRLQIHENTFEKNGWAIRIMANSMDNVFTANNFSQNTFDVATNGRQNFNTFEGNFWGNYRGYDLNADGIGDVPFRPVRLFSYIVQKQPSALVLLRSMFVHLLDFAESVLPMLTPETLVDKAPLMQPAAL